MSEHNHYQTLRSSTLLFPILLVVLFFEAPAVIFKGQLAIGAHSLDVLSDVTAFLIVIFGAFLSGKLDDRGREHKALHREQKLIALVNLLIIWIGAVLILGKAFFGFNDDSRDLRATDWWVILGPLLAIVAYWWIGKRLQIFSTEDLTVESLNSHIKGDVAVSAVALLLTILNLIASVAWINSVGGIIMSAILLIVSWELIAHIRYADKEVLTKCS